MSEQNTDSTFLFPGMVNALPRDLIDADPTQPRTEFEDGPLQALADDIRARGITDPLRVRRHGERYLLVDGERRWRAAGIAELGELPCLLDEPEPTEDPDATNLAVLIRQAASSILRQELSVLDKARLYKRLVDEFNVKMADLPTFIKTHNLGDYQRSTLSNLIRMLELPDWVLEKVRANEMPASACKSLLQVAPFDGMLDELKTWFDQYDDDVDEGRPTENLVGEWCTDIMADQFINADLPHSKTAPYYDVEAHEKDVGVVSVHGIRFITNREAHDKLQAEHPKPHPNSPAARAPYVHGTPDTGSSTGTGESSSRSEPAEKKPKTNLLEVRNRETVETYLLDWWRSYLSLHHGRDETLINAILSWCAFGWQNNHHDYVTTVQSQQLPGALYNVAGSRKRNRLGAFLAEPLDDEDRHALVDAVFPCLGKTAIADLVTHYGHTMDECYRVDEDYLKLHTRATLEHMVRKTVLKTKKDLTTTEDGQAWKACKRTPDFHAWCLQRKNAIGAPPDISKVWKEILRQVKA